MLLAKRAPSWLRTSRWPLVLGTHRGHAVSALGLALALGCGPPLDLRTGAEPPLELPPAELQGVVFEGWTAGARDVQVRAAAARVDVQSGAATLEAVELAFAGSERGEVEVSAERATLDLSSEDFVLRGDVVGRTGAGDRFTTDEIRYEAAGARLISRRPVRVDRRGLVLRGDGMEMDLARQRLRVTGHVRTELGGS